MLAPLSWLKDYVNIKSDPKSLGLRLTEIGLGTEKITKTKDGDYIFDLEITPNRPDLLSILGIAREVAAVENTEIKYPKSNVNVLNIKPKNILPLEIKTDHTINPRFTAIVIDGITIKDSPVWLKEKLEKIGQRPINNIVDITNFVMYELGNPLHAFDYDKITGHVMRVDTAKAGEEFKSVDGVIYHLPKGAVVIRDREKIIDLCGIKGGENSGTYEDTKTIVIRVPVEVPVMIRKTSQALGLRSDASSIFERAVNAGGTIEALNRAVSLILELAGGEVASTVYDLRRGGFEPWKLSLAIERLNQILGIEIPQKKVISILESLNLKPVMANNIIECTVPTYRNDLKIEEDLIEEVARIYGYNNFPKTLPAGEIPTEKIPHFKDYGIDENVKNILTAAGFSEVYTYALVSENDLNQVEMNSEHVLRVDTPVSREYEYLRPTLKINLQKALNQNKANFDKVSLFELGKVYIGKSLDKIEEKYHLAGATNSKNFFEVKGILERLYKDLGVDEDPTESVQQITGGIYFEIDYSAFLEKINTEKVFVPVAKFPPVMEDLSIIAPANAATGELISAIKKHSPLVADVSLLDKYQDTRTFHIVYQSRTKNLTSKEVGEIREKILKLLKEKHGARLKE